MAESPELRTQPARSHHICFKSDDGWGVVDVWEFEESFGKFGELLAPTLQKFGLQGEPRIQPVHNTL